MHRIWYWVIVDYYGEGRYVARAPGVPTITAVGRVPEEAISVVSDSIEAYLRELAKGGPLLLHPSNSVQATSKEVGRYQIWFDIPPEVANPTFRLS